MQINTNTINRQVEGGLKCEPLHPTEIDLRCRLCVPSIVIRITMIEAITSDECTERQNQLSELCQRCHWATKVTNSEECDVCHH